MIRHFQLAKLSYTVSDLNTLALINDIRMEIKITVPEFKKMLLDFVKNDDLIKELEKYGFNKVALSKLSEQLKQHNLDWQEFADTLTAKLHNKSELESELKALEVHKKERTAELKQWDDAIKQRQD
ncbi:MAG: hypothetical protein ACP5TW_06365, partial [Thermoplasmata archaeon]